MNDLPSLARQARANLAQALSALQEDNVPPKTQALASIVAEAMNLLHRIEKNHDVVGFDRWDHSTRALLLVRTALNNLQAPEHSHPTTENVLEPAAQAVRLVHQLNQLTAKRESDPPQPESLAPTNPAPLGQTSEVANDNEAPAAIDVAPSQAVSHDHASLDHASLDRSLDHASLDHASLEGVQSTALAAEPESVEPILPPPSQLDTSPETNQANTVRASEEEAPATPRVDVNNPNSLAVTAERTFVAPLERASSNPERISTNPVRLPALDPLPGEVYIEVSLGAYSTSNFYRLVLDADVVDGGGLFVATYAPPELAQPIRVRATLTGGFAFEGRGTVDWRRRMPKSGSLNPLTPPGFGLKFTELSDEARKLVHRYSRSREPFVRDADVTQ